MGRRNKKNHVDGTNPSWASLGNANDDAGVGWKSGHGTPRHGTSNAGSYGSSAKDFTTPGVMQAPTQLGLQNSGGGAWGESGSVNDEAGDWHGYGYGPAAGYGRYAGGHQHAGPSYLKDLTTPGVVQAPTQVQLGLLNSGGLNHPTWGHSGSVNDEAGGWYGYVPNEGSYTSSLKDFTRSGVVQSPMQVQLGLQNSGGPAWQYSYAGNDSPGGGSY